MRRSLSVSGYVNHNGLSMYVKGHSENITGGLEAFSIFTSEIWAPSSEDWQNLGTPSKDWQNLGTPSEDWQNLGTPIHIFFNNTAVCILWPYLSYFISIDN